MKSVSKVIRQEQRVSMAVDRMIASAIASRLAFFRVAVRRIHPLRNSAMVNSGRDSMDLTIRSASAD